MSEPDWTKHETEDGHVYYYNSSTAESKWHDEFEKMVYDLVSSGLVYRKDLVKEIPEFLIRKQGSLAWKKDSWHYHWGNLFNSIVGVVVIGRLLIFKDERV